MGRRRPDAEIPAPGSGVVEKILARFIGAPARVRLPVHAMLAMAAAQVGLGIATLLLSVPVVLAVAHQAGAVVLFSLALWARFELRPAPG